MPSCARLQLAISQKHVGALRALLEDALFLRQMWLRPPLPPPAAAGAHAPQRRVNPLCYAAAFDDDTADGELLTAVLAKAGDAALVTRNQDAETCLMAGAHSRSLAVEAFRALCDRCAS